MTRRVPPLREINGYFKGADADVLGRCAFVFLRYRGEALSTDGELFFSRRPAQRGSSGFSMCHARSGRIVPLSRRRATDWAMFFQLAVPQKQGYDECSAYGLT